MMMMTLSWFVSVLSLLWASLLVPTLAELSDAPNVTVIPLGTDCSGWPNYQRVRGVDITGGFTFVSDQTQDAGSNGLRLRSREYRDASNETHSILVVDVRMSHLLNTVLTSRCVNGTVFYGYTGLDAKPPIVIDSNGVLKPEGSGFKLEPYAHEINGVRQPGVFLGTKGLTTWGFDYVQPADCGARDFYYIWLIGVSQVAMPSPVLRGFIKAEGL